MVFVLVPDGAYHIESDVAEQDKGYPMLEGLYPAGKELYAVVAYGGHPSLEYAEGEDHECHRVPYRAACRDSGCYAYSQTVCCKSHANKDYFYHTCREIDHSFRQ